MDKMQPNMVFMTMFDSPNHSLRRRKHYVGIALSYKGLITFRHNTSVQSKGGLNTTGTTNPSYDKTRLQ